MELASYFPSTHEIIFYTVILSIVVDEISIIFSLLLYMLFVLIDF